MPRHDHPPRRKQSLSPVISDHKRVILVVDNEPQLRKLNCRLLERAGYLVLLAGGGAEALTVSRGYDGQIDLLLSDIEMNDMSGIDLAHQMTAERPGIRVLLNSANPAFAEQEEFAFLAKPYSPEELRSAVAAVLGVLTGAKDTLHRHIGEDEMEQYLLNHLPEPELRRCEEHLLVCEECRTALENADSYVSAIRSVTRQHGSTNAADKSSRQWPHTGLILAAAAVIVVAIVPLGLHQLSIHSSAPEVLNLQASRGLAGEALAIQGKALVLNLDTSGLPQLGSYRIELVSATGRAVWEKVVRVQGSEVGTPSAGLQSGIYFVRVYSPAGELLREYALRVDKKP